MRRTACFLALVIPIIALFFFSLSSPARADEPEDKLTYGIAFMIFPAWIWKTAGPV